MAHKESTLINYQNVWCAHSYIIGDAINVSGNIGGIYGDITGFSGCCSGISGVTDAISLISKDFDFIRELFNMNNNTVLNIIYDLGRYSIDLNSPSKIIKRACDYSLDITRNKNNRTIEINKLTKEALFDLLRKEYSSIP